MSDDPFRALDPMIHGRTRMAIMSLLAGGGSLSFTELRDELSLTDGNLSVQLRTLQRAGYVAVTKAYRRRRPLTTATLTEEGERAFAAYVDALEEIVRRAREAAGG